MKSTVNQTASAARFLQDRGRSRQHSVRLFTVDEANRMLPLVRRITRDVLRLARSVRHLRFRLKFIALGGDELEQMFPAEIRGLRQHLERVQFRLDECIDELLQLGIEPEAPTLGLVDFPALIDERAVYLCWRHDESEIAWWHPLNGGFVDRQPLAELCSDSSNSGPVRTLAGNR